TGDQVGAEEAASMGLAHKVVPADELDDEVEQLCSRLVANAPLTLRAVKLSIASAAGRGDRQTALDAIADCWASEDFAEGRAAFSEHREPRFRGR
ncbi:MAG: enoyl-CoA hydratase, partial [Acidimicrobiia bacterium]|nr:enoyl-CoA hydratase [Acidimicrobiia bacterium]